MSHRTTDASAGEFHPATRPLPPRPSLEFERKQAKVLLRRLRVGDANAVTRANDQHVAPRSSGGAAFTLADAQFVIAREYGFASWPRLVQYFGDVERQRFTRRSRQLHRREFYESSAHSLILQHRSKRSHAGRSLAASVPRFYGKTIDEVFAASVNEDDARLTVARQNGCASWDMLMEAVDTQRARRADPFKQESAALALARKAIYAGDLAALTGIIAEHAELLQASDEERREGRTVVAAALSAEERNIPGARATTDWLASQGVDVGLALNESLCTWMFQKTERVRLLLERGADPNWIAPNGISLLEHALLLHWNGEAVDLIAQRVTPKHALWIAAGLGDVGGVSRFLDRRGKPIAAAYRDRPDFLAVGGPTAMLSAPMPDSMELLGEAFMVAVLNDRVAVVDYMIDRGFPVDYLGWDMPFVSFAAGNQRLRVVECLVRRGADLDLRGRHPDMSAREMARERFENAPTDPTARRILELCGLDPASVIAEMEARPGPEPEIMPSLQEAFDLAGDDAIRRGQTEIHPEDLLIGMFRVEQSLAMEAMQWARVDREQLRLAIGTRVMPASDRGQGDTPPMSSAAEAVVNAAIAIVRQRKGESVSALHVLRTLCDVEDAFLSDILARCESSVAKLRERLADDVL